MASEMTSQEIDNGWARLGKIQRRRLNGNANEDVLKDLKELALDVRADPLCKTDDYVEAVPELIHRIHFALQTAAMIDASRTAAKNHEIALAAMKETAESQVISKHNMRAAWVAAFGAWAAVIFPPIARLVWNYFHQGSAQ